MEDEENQIVEENESATSDYLSSAANGVQDPFFLPHPAVPNVPGFPNFFQGVVQVGFANYQSKNQEKLITIG